MLETSNRGIFMKIKALLFTAAVLAGVALPGVANAVTYVYAGSWQVDQGPNWTTVPTAYTGQEAAAFLFGGVASDYAISSIDNNFANINNQNWVSTWGGACSSNFPCGTLAAENFKISTGGLYQNIGDTSAYADDWAIGSQYTNFAFKALVGAVPEPATWSMMILGFGLVGASLRSRRNQSVRVTYS
jgi:hypothetical protein